MIAFWVLRFFFLQIDVSSFKSCPSCSECLLSLFKEPLGWGEFLRAQESGGVELRDRVATVGLLSLRLASLAQSWIDGEPISWTRIPGGPHVSHLFPRVGDRTYGRLTWGRSVNPWEYLKELWDAGIFLSLLLPWSWGKQIALPHASAIPTATAQAVPQQPRAVASLTLDQNFQELWI